MHAIARSRRRAGGFTLLEAMVVVTIFGVLLAVGIPKMTHWLQASKATGAIELYGEGLRMARQQAISHNAESRLVLTANAVNGQQDWQVDICFPTATVACTDSTGTWSSTTAIATGDPEGTTGYKSVFRSAGGLPTTAVMTTALAPAGATAVYFNARGWVDTNVANNLSQITLTPTSAYVADLRTGALLVTLAGTAIKCDPNVVSTDSRACTP